MARRGGSRPDPAHKGELMDTRRIPLFEGDPFYASFATHDPEERPHACYEGIVYLGRITEQEGEEVEVFEAVPCGRCAEES